MSSAVNFLKDAPVKKSITVKASAKHAFEVFTAGFDTWWPRSHHIGKAPLKKAIMEGHIGGRCYSEQTDGTECDWGRITTWDQTVEPRANSGRLDNLWLPHFLASFQEPAICSAWRSNNRAYRSIATEQRTDYADVSGVRASTL